jgi:hypothetical protein
MKLTARQVETANLKKPYKLADGGGLYLLVNPNGKRYWRLKYRSLGKEKLLAIGVYPDVSLAEARSKREDAKRTLAAGNDPSLERKIGNLVVNKTQKTLLRLSRGSGISVAMTAGLSPTAKR